MCVRRQHNTMRLHLEFKQARCSFTRTKRMLPLVTIEKLHQFPSGRMNRLCRVGVFVSVVGLRQI